MSNNIDNKGVSISVKIYERLLAACPAEFRREYGPAMKQLFRDQCRDAWNEAQGRGLAILWLRVLPDLAKTSIVEHLLHLRLRTAFIRVFMVAFLCMLGLSVCVAYWSRAIYLSEAKVLLRGEETENRYQKNIWRQPPELMVAHCAIIKSIDVLSPVITKLNLQHVLASQAGEPGWPLDQTYDKLVQQVNITPSQDVITILVKNPDPNLSAKIANDIVDSYRDFIKKTNEQFVMNWRSAQLQIQSAERSGKQHVLPRSSVIHIDETDMPPMPTPMAVNIISIEMGVPNQNAVVQTKRKIFFIWAFGGTLLALVAGGGCAWLTYITRRFFHRQGSLTGLRRQSAPAEGI